MRTLEGLYKAICLGVDNQGEVIRCQVPQIFNDETVTCFDVAGGVFPLEGDEGWVVFESGFPDHPVWLAASEGISSPDVTPGAGVIDITAGPGIAVTPGQHPVVTNIGVVSLVAGQAVVINASDPLHTVVGTTIPPGGAVDQVLAKSSVTDYALKWSGPMLPLTGGTLTGQLTINKAPGALALAFVGDGEYLGYYDNTGNTRRGYLQGGANGMSLSSDIGDIILTSASQRVFFPGSVVVGVPANFPGYAGLAWNNGNYLFMSDGTNAFITSPGAGGTVSIRCGSNGGYQLNINANGTHTMAGHLNIGGYNIDSSGIITSNGFNLYGNNSFYFASYGGGWYMTDGSYVRSTNDKHVWIGGGWYGGNGGIQIGYNGVSGGSYMADFNGNMRVVGVIDCGNHMGFGLGYGIYFNGRADPNHYIRYSNETPAYSGEASNGPKMGGWATCWMHTAAGGYGGNYGWDAFLSPNGHLFISPGCGFYNFSSREFKDNIVTLDPQECLEQVLRWRPVEYDQDVQEGDDLVVRHSTGFITEEMVDVTPTAVNITGPDNERPGWANAMNYPSLTVQLAGAVQALEARLNALEAA